jgi:hypothetical protein
MSDNFQFIVNDFDAAKTEHKGISMTYNEAIIEARDKVSETSKSWFIFKDGGDEYHVGDNVRQLPSTAIQNRHHDLRVTAVIDPVWQE